MPEHSKRTLFQELQQQRPQYPEENIRYAGWLRWLILGVTILLCTAFFPSTERQPLQYKVGMQWTQPTLVAQYTFPVFKPKSQYETEIRKIKEQTPPVFLLNAAALIESENIVRSFLESLLWETIAKDTLQTLTAFSPPTRQALYALPREQYNALINRLTQVVLEFQKSIYSRGYINILKKNIRSDSIVVRLSATEELWLPKHTVLDVNDYITEATFFVKRQPRTLESELIDTLTKLLHIPNLLFSHELTQELQNALAASVPRTVGIVQKGEIIVREGERIDELTALKLAAYYHYRLMQQQQISPLLRWIGNLGHAFLICTILFLYLFILRKRIFYDNWKLAGICAILVSIAAMTWITTIVTKEVPAQFLILLPAASMLIAILFDSRTAFYSTVVMAMLVAGIRSSDYLTALALLVSGTLAAYTVRDLQSRGQLFKAIGSILVGSVLAILVIAAEQLLPSRQLFLAFGFAFLNAVFSPILTFGIVLLLERTTNITTDLRILEFDRLDHPLLQQLEERAPGTYQHTLNVAHLAESAARAIGANALLTRVGAYYHDIGKIPKAEYFIENQIGIENKHEHLSPWQSALIIRNHIKEGIELGKQYGLPQRILDFIPQHHGTMLITYFYQKALEIAKEKGLEVNEEDFRYPGPKPQTKETTILMIVDGVEALARTLSNYDQQTIENAVEKLIEDRFLNGQFDESPLSFRELRIIQRTLVRHLLGMGHPRVRYPNQQQFEQLSSGATARASSTISSTSPESSEQSQGTSDGDAAQR